MNMHPYITIFCPMLHTLLKILIDTTSIHVKSETWNAKQICERCIQQIIFWKILICEASTYM